MISEYQFCTVVPLAPIGSGVFSYDILDANASRIDVDPILISSRAHRTVRPLRKRRLVGDNTLKGQFLWGGVFYYHFGHFITETLPMILYLRHHFPEQASKRLLFIASPEGRIHGDLPPYMREILDIFNIDLGAFVVLNQPTQIEDMTVARGAFERKYRYSSNILPALTPPNIVSSPQPSGGRIFMSRSALNMGSESRTGYGVELDAIARSLGYDVVHPETLSLRDQLDMICTAKVLAGVNGSALHWALYSKNVETVQSIGWFLKLQKGICDLREQHLQTVQTPIIGRFQGRKMSVPLQTIEQALSE